MGCRPHANVIVWRHGRQCIRSTHQCLRLFVYPLSFVYLKNGKKTRNKQVARQHSKSDAVAAVQLTQIIILFWRFIV